jgi:RND family efflux transporter MFP subunit
LKEGDTVAAGTLLFVIDPKPFQATFDASVAARDRAVATLDRLTADLARAEKLRLTNNISSEEFDRIAASKAEAAATLAQSTAEVNSAKTNLDYTQIKAPITGRLGNARVSRGNLVTAQTTILTTIVREDPIFVYFDLSEQTVERYRALIRDNQFTSARQRELPVEVGLSSEQGYPHRGVIDFIDNAMNRPTASLRLRGRFENPDVGNGVRMLSPNMFIPRVRIAASRLHEGLLISERAILTDRADKIVYVVEADGTARRRVVELGALHDRLREIKAGLKADERIVVNGLPRVRDGAKVEPQEGPMPGATATGTTATTATEMKK